MLWLQVSRSTYWSGWQSNERGATGGGVESDTTRKVQKKQTGKEQGESEDGNNENEGEVRGCDDCVQRIRDDQATFWGRPRKKGKSGRRLCACMGLGGLGAWKRLRNSSETKGLRTKVLGTSQLGGGALGLLRKETKRQPVFFSFS